MNQFSHLMQSVFICVSLHSGAGMICPHWVNYSMMVGAIVSWGIMWPLLRGQAGPPL